MRKLSIRDALILSAILVVAGKLTGFLRDLTLAIVYGADKQTDAFFAANIIPSLSLTAFYSTITLAFMPFYIKKLKSLGPRGANVYANAMLWVYLAITAMITLATILAAPILFPLIAPKFDSQTTALAIQLVNIFSLSFFFSVSCAFFSSIQYAHDIRLGQQLSPLINNTIFVVAIFGFGHLYDIRFAAIMTIVGWLVQLPIQIYFTRGKFKFSRPALPVRDDVSTLLKLSGPVFVALFLEQGIMTTAVYFSAKLQEGAVSIVTYANKLSNLPLTLSVMLITIYIYPAMTRLAADNDHVGFNAYLGRMSRLIVMLAVPAVIISWFHGGTLARIAFGASKLSASDILDVGNLFSIYMVGIVFLVLRDLTNRYFYAKTIGFNVMLVTATFVLLNVVLCYFFVEDYGLSGIAISTTLAAIAAFALQLLLLIRATGRAVLDIKFIVATIAGAVAMTSLFLASSASLGGASILLNIVVIGVAGLVYLAIIAKGYGFSKFTNKQA